MELCSICITVPVGPPRGAEQMQLDISMIQIKHFCSINQSILIWWDHPRTNNFIFIFCFGRIIFSYTVGINHLTKISLKILIFALEKCVCIHRCKHKYICKDIYVCINWRKLTYVPPYFHLPGMLSCILEKRERCDPRNETCCIRQRGYCSYEHWLLFFLF